MTDNEVEYFNYLNETGILPKLLEILKQLTEMDPPPADPLMYILHALGCPLIPQAQMKALERKVSRAHDELRYLRRLLIDLDGVDQLYDSESDEDEYVGAVEDALNEPYEDALNEPYEDDLNEPYEDEDDEAGAQALQPQYVEEATVATVAGSAQDQQEVCNR